MNKRVAGGIMVMNLWVTTVLGYGIGFAQTFNSGSTGVLGSLNPGANATIALPSNGILNYTTVTIPSGVTVTFTKNAENTPVVMLAQGDVTIAGTINVRGANGFDAGAGGTIPPGGSGGPGGFQGGSAGSTGNTLPPAGGQGPGGGAPGSFGVQANYGTGGNGPIPLFGGSGGGGASGLQFTAGGSGGGGGGAIVIASTAKITITGTGVITASGGYGGSHPIFQGTGGGGGSGGAIRLVAPQINGTGQVLAEGGLTGSAGSGAAGGPGQIRYETFALGFTGTTFPNPIITLAPGPVTATSTPAVATPPSVTISSIGGNATPVIPGGSYAVPDVALPPGTVNPVPVTITTNNVPAGSVFTLKLLPSSGTPSTVNTLGTTGSFAVATATVGVNFPLGRIAVLNVYGGFTLPTQVASLFPSVDGENVDRVLIAANIGEPSTLTLVTKSGKEVPVLALSQADQRKVAMAFEALRASEN